MTHASTEKELYEKWRDDYAIKYEPNYDEQLNADCKAAFIAGIKAGRLATVVQPDQLPQDAAKRAMEELKTEVEKLRSALAECRDACPIPKPGASNEEAWMQSVGDPESVPAFVKSCLQAQVVQQGWKLVPEEPTLEMKRAGMSERNDNLSRAVYQAMLAAAPNPPEQAPVQMPEPSAYANPLAFEQFKKKKCGVHGREWMFSSPHPELVGIYTRNQVLQLLANHASAKR